MSSDRTAAGAVTRRNVCVVVACIAASYGLFALAERAYAALCAKAAKALTSKNACKACGLGMGGEAAPQRDQRAAQADQLSAPRAVAPVSRPT